MLNLNFRTTTQVELNLHLTNNHNVPHYINNLVKITEFYKEGKRDSQRIVDRGAD